MRGSPGWSWGGTITYRTAELKDELGAEVESLWGPANLAQHAPRLLLDHGSVGFDPQASDVKVHFDHHNRYKGLLWFSTYTVAFEGTYTVRGPADRAATFRFALPPGVTVFEELRLAMDGNPLPVNPSKQGNVFLVEMPTDGEPHLVTVAYTTRGRDRWTYVCGQAGEAATTHVRDFRLEVTTNFAAIDYPTGTRSPSEPAEPLSGAAAVGGKTVEGMRAVWQIKDAHTRERMGIEMPARLNAGPVAGRMAFYAPISLFFFLTVLFAVMILKRIPLHPMHYLFIAAGFFAFHILLAYLVDKIDIHYAFWICAAVSVVLVVSYMRLVAGGGVCGAVRRPGPVGVPDRVQLRVLPDGLDGPDGGDPGHRDPVCPDAGHRPAGLERGVCAAGRAA